LILAVLFVPVFLCFPLFPPSNQVQPELERFLAKRMRAATHAVDGSHVPMLSHPGFVIDVIHAAAKAVQGSSATA
jgi:hypothetical protein